MKLSTIKLRGEEYPLIFSAWVIDQIQDHGNGDVEEELDRILNSSRVKDMLWLLSLFLQGGYEAAKILGNDAKKPPTYEELMFLTQVTEFGEIGDAIRNAVAASHPDVQLADDKKNVNTTRPEA